MTPMDATTGCPVHHGFDPLGDEYIADPYPIHSAVREEAPAFYAAAIDMWVITRYDDIEAVLKDPGTFSAAVGQKPVFPMSAEAQDILKKGFRAYPVMSDCDPPRHTEVFSAK